MSRRSILALGVLLLTHLQGVEPARAVDATTYYVASAVDPYRFLLIRSDGVPYYVVTEAAYQRWSGCDLMPRSLGSVVSLTTGTSNVVEFPGSTQTCLLRSMTQVTNALRGEVSNGSFEAEYVVSIADGLDPIAVDVTGTARRIVLAPGCAPLLPSIVGQIVFMGPAPFLGDRPLYLFGVGAICSIGEVTSVGGVSAPKSYASVRTDYEEAGWVATPSGRYVPAIFASSAGATQEKSKQTSRTSRKTKKRRKAARKKVAAPTYFADVPASLDSAPYINQLAASGVIDRGGMFRPSDPVTRAEFAKLVVLASGTTLSKATSGTGFVDVPDGASLAQYVRTAKDKGWAVGQAGRFRPDATVTRMEAAHILHRALGLRTSAATMTSDVSSADGAVLGALEESGAIMRGRASFEPQRALTRGEAAKLVSALQNRR